MGQVRDLIGAQGAAAAGVLGPAEPPGLEECAIHAQLPAALEQIEQAYLALGSLKLVLLVHSQPRHPPAFSRQRITGAGEGLLLHEHLLVRRLPLLLRYDRGCLHRELSFPRLLVSLFHFHFSLLFRFIIQNYSDSLFRFGTISSDPFFLREIFIANAATSPVETAPTTTNPMVAKQNGHIVHLLGGQLDHYAASIGMTRSVGLFRQGKQKNYAGLCSKELSPCGSSLRPIADRMEGWARASLRPALLARLPTPRVAPAVEACDDHNPVNLNLKEYPVGKAPHSRTATAPVNHRKLHRMIRDYLNRRFDCQR